MMVLYWLLILLFLFAAFIKIRHFYNSHWNRYEKSTLIMPKSRLTHRTVLLRSWLLDFQGYPSAIVFGKKTSAQSVDLA